MEKSNIEDIISKQIIEGLTPDEQTLLDNWLSENDENKKTYNAYSELWGKSKDLVLSERIDVEASLARTKKQLGFKSKVKWLTYFKQAAAVLVISLLLSFLYNYLTKTPNVVEEATDQIVYQEVMASYGTRTKLTLADGTNVWLNSGSKLRFPTSFKNTEQRVVDLDGEGFFEVSKDSLHPFIVNTSKLDVKVYGTSFNVTAYNSQRRMTVALTEGKVSVMQEGEKKDRELIVMKPNDVVKYNMNTQKVTYKSESYIEKYTAWKDGQIIFFGDPIDVVVGRLEKWYNVDIVIADKELWMYRFTATFIDESLEQVLKLLSLSSSMDYNIQPAQKLQDNTFSKRKVTLKVKE